jgi:hypothetical protein
MKKKIAIKIHSAVDLITNSSTELFIVDLTKTEGFLKEMFEFMTKESACGCDDTHFESLKNYKYKDDFIIPEDLNQDMVYMCTVDQNNNLLMSILEKYFTVIQLEYKD